MVDMLHVKCVNTFIAQIYHWTDRRCSSQWECMELPTRVCCVAFIVLLNSLHL